MTNQEAKTIMENLIYLYRPLGSSLKAWETAIEALEKQVPKKRTNNSWSHYHCPVCGKSVNNKYCGECGQAIDWEDEE